MEGSVVFVSLKDNLAKKASQLRDEVDDSLHGVGKMKYEVENDTYRDVFNQLDRKRGHQRQVTSPWFNYVGSVLIFLAAFFIPFFAIPWLWGTMADLPHMSDPNFQKPPFSYYLGAFVHSHGGHLAIIGLFFVALGCAGVGYYVLYRNWKVQNIRNDNSDLNTYHNDARLMQPEELPANPNFGIMPDAGMHSKGVQVTAVMGHLMLNNDGLKNIWFTDRYQKDGNGHLKDEPVYDKDGNLLQTSVKPIDIAFGEKEFDSAKLPPVTGKNARFARSLRIRYSPNKLFYNPDGARGKAKQRTVADQINTDWYMPDYEVQRPGGMYIVDTQSNNTMVLAMTRAGKGQTIIEPTIDMWLRMDDAGNIAVNDPKGELYLKFYYVARRRGFTVIAFNLMNESRTNIYNPLGYAVTASRQGNSQQVEEFVANIGDVFFPPDKSDDPMWPNAANAAFKRTALGLIDYYQEEEREMQKQAIKEHWSQAVLDNRLDELWGHVTLYNVYQMMTQLASKKSDDPKKIKIGEDDTASEKDYLTLFMDATNALPQNDLRTAVRNQDQSLRAMAGSDKTISSVYGISLTAVKFFADEKISKLTSGRPSQNFDIVGMAFPRRFEVRIDSEYVEKHALKGQRYHWTVYSDPKFSKPLGKEFNYENNIDSRGWVTYTTKGIFPQSRVYMKLVITDHETGMPMKKFLFQFTKGHQVSLNGRSYVPDPVTGKRIIKGGTLEEMRRMSKRDPKTGDVISVKYVRAHSVTQKFIHSLVPGHEDDRIKQTRQIISQVDVHYSEEPKIVFFVTPPHLMSYAKIVLILLNQLFNMQVSKSYMTLKSQKPYYVTRYMLDEIGNLQSEGNGIPFLQTKESIGLGQSQQYTLILQTLQQLKDIYGDSVDAILQGNTSNIIYLKSTDDSMLEKLQALSGSRHEARQDSRTVQYNAKDIINPTDSKISENTTLKEEPVIKKNDMLLVPMGNAMVFGHGNPIWNHNQTAMPFSYCVTTGHKLRDLGGHGADAHGDYTLATVPTTSNTYEFNVLNNQPNFYKMVQKRVRQARLAPTILEQYKKVYGHDGKPLTDNDLSRMDQEELSKALMDGINEEIANEDKQKEILKENQNNGMANLSEADQAMFLNDATSGSFATPDADDYANEAEENKDFDNAYQDQEALAQVDGKPIYAQGQISKNMIRNMNDDVKGAIAMAYNHLLNAFKNDNSGEFTVDNHGNLLYNVGSDEDPVMFIESSSQDLAKLEEAADDPENKNVKKVDFNKQKGNVIDFASQYVFTQDFKDYLISKNSWQDILGGRFDSQVAQAYRSRSTDDVNDTYSSVA